MSLGDEGANHELLRRFGPRHAAKLAWRPQTMVAVTEADAATLF
mgnify:CR=1 FL=1